MTVIFRKSFNRSVFAILVEGKCRAGLVTKVGEDGSRSRGDYHSAIRTSKPAVPDEYFGLKRLVEHQVGEPVSAAMRII